MVELKPAGLSYGSWTTKRDRATLNVYPWLGGTFERFSGADLARRYPTRDSYIDLVRKAAAALLSLRFVLKEAYKAYITAAKRSW